MNLSWFITLLFCALITLSLKLLFFSHLRSSETWNKTIWGLKTVTVIIKYWFGWAGQSRLLLCSASLSLLPLLLPDLTTWKSFRAKLSRKRRQLYFPWWIWPSILKTTIVVSTLDSASQDSVFDSRVDFACFHCVCVGFSSASPADSHSPETFTTGRLVPVGVNKSA